MPKKKENAQIVLPISIRAWEITKGIAKIVIILASVPMAFYLQWDDLDLENSISYIGLSLLILVTNLCILSMDKQKKLWWWFIPVLFSTLLCIQKLNTLKNVWDLSLDNQTSWGILAANLFFITLQLLVNMLLPLILTKFLVWIRRKTK